MSEYKVGGKVVAIRNHSEGYFKSGQVYAVLGIGESECCGTLTLNIGVPSSLYGMSCIKCGGYYKEGDPYAWFLASSFVPVDDMSLKQVTYTKIIEEIPVGAN